MRSQLNTGFRRVWAVMALALVACVSTNAVATEFEKAIPGDVVALANMPNVSLMKTRMDETSIAALFKDEAMKPFVDNLMGEVQLLLDTAEQITGISLADIVSLPTGQVTIAGSMDAESEGSLPAVYFVADCKGNEDKLKDITTKIMTALEENGMTKEMVGDIIVYTIGDAEKKQQFAHVVKGSVLAISNDPEALGKVVANIEKGSEDSIGSSEKFTAFRERAGRTGHIEVFVDLAKLIEYASDQGRPEINTAVGMLGLNAFESGGLSASFGENDNEVEYQLLVNTKGTSPVFDLFKMPVKAIKPEPWVPADIVSYGSFNWDIDSFYNKLIEMVNAVQPGAMEQVEAMLQGPDPQNPLLNIQKDLIGPLGNRLTMVTDMITEESEPNPRFLIAWELEDSQKLTELFDRLMALAGGALPLETKSVNGNTVYTFPLGDLVAAQVDAEQMPLKLGVFGFTITKTHFMMSTHVELLDKCLTQSEGGLVESEAYKTVAAKMPAEVSMIGVTRTDEEAKAAWQALKAGKLAESIRKAMESQEEVGAFLGGIIDALDGSNLPEFDAVSKYFLPSGSYAIQDEKGLKYVGFVPKK